MIQEDVRLETWIPWAAGLFEGEGSVGKSNSRSVIMSVSSTDPEVVERFCAILRCGHLATPIDRTGRDHIVHSRKVLYTWVCHGVEAAERAYELMRPYLSARRKAQFETAIREGARKYDRSRVHRWKRHAYEQEREAIIDGWRVQPILR